uniref:Kelch like family member 2 n=1 Tax=Gasterosteus aculeatus aculeatus TaxID=481459 RepID=G3PXU5_GASAC
MRKAFKVMNELRSQSLLCDVTIVAEDVEIAAHRVVLAAGSPYFHAMFTGEMAESRAKRVRIKEMDGWTLGLLVDYIYTAEIQVTEDNVQALLPAAGLLQLNEVKKACCEFLSSQLHPSNCLGIRAFADLHACSQLLTQANSYAGSRVSHCTTYFHSMLCLTEQHFTEVVGSEEFLNLGMEQVSSLIASDKLTIPTEEKVFEAVIAWVNHDKDVRQEHLAHLMEHVRLPLLSREYLVQRVEEESLIKNSSACKDYLIEAMKYHLLPADQRALMKTARTRMRTPACCPKVMVVVGGQAPKAIRSVECYDFEGQRWYQVAELPTRRCRAGRNASMAETTRPFACLYFACVVALPGVVYVGGCVYAVGGFNGSLRVRTVDCYDPTADRWTSVSSMQDRRSTLGAAVLNGLLYAVGGFDGSTGLSTIEAYNAKTDEWFHVLPMSTRRSSVGVGVVNGILYAIGGYDGATRQCLSTVESYNPKSNAWSYIAEMGTRRSGAGVGVLKGLLYAVGGHDGPLVRKSCEVYDPASNSWRQVADMNMCRRNAGVCAVNNVLYVVGGDDGSCNLASVEFYNPNSDKWTLLPACMSTGRSYAGV